MYSITDLKKGTLIQIDGTPYRVTEYNQKQLGRGGSIVNTKLKSLLDGRVLDKTFKGSEKVEKAQLERFTGQFLYTDANGAHFMNMQTYEQFEVSLDVVGETRNFLREDLDVQLLQFNGRIIGVELPPNLVYTVKQADPGVRGDTATAALKGCVIETGLKVQVPLFVNAGDRIKVDTRSGEYLGRE